METSSVPRQYSAHKALKNKKAFTLVEFLVASSLILLVLGSAALATINSQKAVRSANAYAEAASVQQSILEKMKAGRCGEAVTFTQTDCVKTIVDESKISNNNIEEIKIAITFLPANSNSLESLCQPSASTNTAVMERTVSVKIKNNDEIKHARLLTYPSALQAERGVLVKGIQASSTITPFIEIRTPANPSIVLTRYLNPACYEENKSYNYMIPNLPTGDYQISVVDRLGTRSTNITVTNGFVEVTP